MSLKSTTEDYAKYCDGNLNTKLEPVYKCIDDMLTRLEEFQTMISFVIQDRGDSVKVLSSFLDHKNEFDDLCKKIDTIETLTNHIKTNLNKLEEDIEKAEADFHISEASKVANLFTPFFKKPQEKKSSNAQHLECFQAKDYFQSNDG